MTIKKIAMPQLGESVTEGTISKWLVSPGDRVNKYDSIAEVMTDKVSAEIPSLFSGIIKDIVAIEGETLAVNEIICIVETADSNFVENTENIHSNKVIQNPVQKGDDSKKMRYSPAVLKLSQQYGIDLLTVTGSGLEGRITRKDILAIINKKEVVENNNETLEIKQALQNESVDGNIEIPVTGLRKKIAENMVRSKTEIPHAWMMIEVDVTNLVQYRNNVKNQFLNDEQLKLTYFPFFVKVVARALKKFPQLNSTWAEDKIIQKKNINLSIAIATEEALFVPVIKNADEKSIKGIVREINDFVKKANDNTLSTDDISDGTFTVNNTGSFGSIKSMGVINHPQAAILQVESIVKRPVVINNMIAVRDIVNLCLSIDHRVLDGLVAGRFLQYVKEQLESTSESTMSLY